MEELSTQWVADRRHPYFSDYSITTDGRVISHSRGKSRELKQIKRAGYPRVKLTHNGKLYTKSVHRLVAETYIENPHNLPQVNHINEVKDDNRVENLEWCTAQYNSEYSKSKYYFLEHIESGNVVEVFNLMQVCRDLNLTYSAIWLTQDGRRNHHKGYRLMKRGEEITS